MIDFAETGAAVRELQDQAAVFAMSCDEQIHRAAAGFHSMPKRILQQRLQDELRHKRTIQGRIDGIGDAQLVFESLLYQVEIKQRDFQFFAKRYLMRAKPAA